MTTRGKYVCIEGMDGSGKSTLARMLATHLPAHGFFFPSDGPVGKLIRAGLQGETTLNQQAYLYLFCADGLQSNVVVETHLAAGRHVICDRHPTLSGRVFQVDHHEAEIVERVYDGATIDGVLVPDHLFVLDVPPEVSLARMGMRSKYKDVVFESDDLAKIAKFRDRYRQLAERYNATVLNGELTVLELATTIIKAVLA